MSGNSTGNVLGATTTTAGIAVLPSTGGNNFMHLAVLVVIAIGVLVTISFTTSRLYRKLYR